MVGKRSLRVATDVGGTFTDLVCIETDPASGRQSIRTAKSPTTPGVFEQGILNVLEKAEVPLSEVEFFVHGTTVVINALTERKGVKTGLITTQGFRDILGIQRGNRPDFFNMLYQKPEPFVPRYLRREMAGRMNWRGEEKIPLDMSVLDGILADFDAEGIEAIAVSFINAYANPAHETAVATEIRKRRPGLSVIASSEITREWREFERTSTSVLSAYVQPPTRRYLERLEQGLDGKGFHGALYVMQSNCGMDSLEASKKQPIAMVESGPASGFWAAAQLGKLIGESNILALDIGGTTAKCSLIVDGEITVTTDYWIERNEKSSGYPIMVPVVDLVEIGNGGGSIARVDARGKLHVGPQSAGADPGPASYGKGGTGATTTDANLALGRINPDFFCGGSLTPDLDALDAALSGIGAVLGGDAKDAARAIIRVANANMTNALKLVSVNRGYDPRDFALVVFGGGGAMHGAALARELGCRKVIVPRGAPVFSAWGMMMSDLRRDYFVTRMVEMVAGADQALAALNEVMAEITGQAVAQFAAEEIAESRLNFCYDLRCRYQNQEHSVDVRLPSGRLDAVQLEAVIADFHRNYEREYTYSLAADVEFVGFHVVVTADVGRLEMTKLLATGLVAADAMKGLRRVDYAEDGLHDAAIYDAEKLEPGMSFDGPAIVEDSGTTIVVPPGCSVRMDDYGNAHVEIRGDV